MSKVEAVKMRINVAGYLGNAVSMMCAFDAATDVLLVARAGEYEAGDRAGFLRITTQDKDAFYDAIFPEEEMREAITAYFGLDSLNLINLTDSVRQHEPKNRIERNGIDDHGPVYRINPEITNGQIAVLIASYYAKRQRNVASVGAFFGMLTDGDDEGDAAAVERTESDVFRRALIAHLGPTAY